MLDLELINKAAHRIYPTHLNEEAPASSFSWNAILPSAAKSTLKNSEGHKETSGRNSHTLTHKLKGGASIEFNVTGNGKNNIVMAKYQKGGKLFTAIHSHEDPHEAMSTVYHSIKKRMVTEEIESTLVEKMAKRIEKKTGKLSDKKEKIDVEPSEEKELRESTPPGMESWVKKNKAHFVKEYGEKKGHEVLYATAWKLHDKMNEEELNESKFVVQDGREFTTQKGATDFYPEVHHVFHNGEHVGYVRQDEIQPYKKIAGSRLVKPLAKRKVWNFHLDQGHSLDGKSVKYRDSSGFGSKKAALESLAKHHKSSKLSEAEYTDTKSGILAQLDYHHGRENYHRQSAEMDHRKADTHAIGSESRTLYRNVAKGQEAIANHHAKMITDLHKRFAALHESEHKIEMMYLSKGFVSPQVAEKIARESKCLGTDASTGECHYVHPKHGRVALIQHKPSGQFQFRLAEEVNQLDELSPSTLGRYIKHAAINKASHAAHGSISHMAMYNAENRGDKKEAAKEAELSHSHKKKEDKRMSGILKATDKLVRKAYGLHEAAHPDQVVQTSGIHKDLGGGHMARTRNGHFYKLNAKELKGELPHIGSVLDVSKHKFLGKHKVDLSLLKEELNHEHPDMKAYYAATKARDEAHLASIRYRMNHDIKQPIHRAKYDELEAEHHRLRDIENLAAEKVHGRLFAHHATKK